MIDIDIVRQVAVRAWTNRAETRRQRKRRRPGRNRLIEHALVIDTETTADEAQALLFGAFRYCRVDDTTVTTIAEGLIYPDDLPERDPDGYATLRRYAATHKANVDLTYLAAEPNWELQLVSRSQFVQEWLWHVGYPHHNRRDPAAVVMFNAPFDLSRLAVETAEARDDMRGGFSLTLWHTPDGKPRGWRPRIAIKVLDSKRAFLKFRRLERGRNDHPGHLLDLRTWIFALTGDGHTLDSACTAFQVPGKAAPPKFGEIDETMIDYCRQDVAATTGLFEAVLAEHTRHPVDLPPTQAYSPASYAKAYLRQMGIIPRLVAQPEFPDQVLGWAMSAFYGGRAEVHIRHTPLPVLTVDFTSMYPTVDILLGLWNLITAERVDAVDATDEVNALLATITLDDCFQPERWREFVAIAEIVPDGDVLPVRADYRGHGQDWTIGVNPLHADQPFWFTLPDLIASTLLSGRRPTVRRAVRLVPRGRQPVLRPVRLRGDIPVDPVTEDFFQTVVQARQQLLRQRVPDHPHGSCPCRDCGTARFLKVLANAGSYGIYAQMDRHELATGDREDVTVHGPTEPAFRAKVAAPEDPGEFCFPPVAAVITGAARLMLALLERLVADAGGSWMFCDTDSMAIVATDRGGLLPCPGGDQRLPDGTPAVRALSQATVEQIRGRFRALNPYDPTVVSDLLKSEDTGTCYAISAKRYVISDNAT